MSKGYGIDIYGIDFYGYSQPADYSVAPFIASQTGYREITLTWASPNVTTWKLLHLVRSVYGFPAAPADGILVQEITPATIIRSYDDPQLTPGTIYYYTMFIAVEAPTWNVATTYPLNSQVLYNNLYWSATQSNTGQTPAAGSTYWTPTSYLPTWLPAGYTATLALGNQGYGDMLYNRAPQPYKINTSDTFSNTVVDNPALQNYLSLFGFGLDIVKAQYDSLLQNNNPDTVSATQLDLLGQQLGINTDYLSTPQQRRQRVKNAAVNYRMKGQTQGIHNLIAEVTGWDSEINYGPNMMNSADQSAFVHPSYDKWNVNTTYFPNNLIQYNGFNYKNLVQSVGQTQAPTGTNSSNTWWQVQVQILDTTVNLNPRTNKYSTWSTVGNPPTGVTYSGILTGLPHPTDSTINNWNAISATQTSTFSSGSFELFSTTQLNTPNYSSGTNYVINNYVLNADGYYYRAAKPSGPGTPYGAITPGTNQTFWQPFYYITLDRPNNIRDSVAIPQLPYWNSTKQYSTGDTVQYLGIVYRATFNHNNHQPTGYYYSNTYWAALYPAQNTVVVSGEWARLTNVATVARARSYLNFYDKRGVLIRNYEAIDPGYIQGYQGITARFVLDYADLNTTTEPSLANAESNVVILDGSWDSTPATANMWYTSYGMASVNQTLAGTTTYVYSLINPGAGTGGRLAVTFVTPYIDITHKTHGIIFAYTNATNFYYVTRQSLRKVTAGVDVIQSSWTRLEGEQRIVVDVGDTIAVSKYARTGDGKLTIIGSSTGNGAISGQIGLIQKYSATGDL